MSSIKRDVKKKALPRPEAERIFVSRPRARIVLTDSGGVQEETTVLGVPCLTLRENTERPATVQHGSNQVVGVDSDRILAAARSIFRKPARQSQRPPMWDGKAAPRIVAIIHEHLQGDDLA